MKRSEAIDTLVKTLGSYDGWKDQCEYMLSELERLGMLPPDRSGGGCNDPSCCGGPDHSWTDDDDNWPFPRSGAV